MTHEHIVTRIKGHVKIYDKDTKEILLDKYNAIHFENISLALARSIANKELGPIERMFFGNGGATVNSLEEVTYLPENTIGISADLYNPTYSKIVDDNNPNNPDPDNNRMQIGHIGGNLYSDLLVICTLNLGEPSDQDVFDQAGSLNDDYVFDEIGLKDYAGNLLTHIIFSPIQKSSNRSYVIEYTIRFEIV